MDQQQKNGVISASHAGGKKRPDPEVQPRAQRRSFTAAYKQRILAEADAATSRGSIGARLRREGLYSSHLTHWRQERSAAIEQGLQPRTRGPKTRIDPSAKELQQLRRAERQAVLAELHSERFRDCAPAAECATLLDEGCYPCSARTMCRLLQKAGQSRERRNQLTHPAYETLNCSPRRPIRSGAGTSPSRWVRPICTSFSMSIPAIWSVLAHRESAPLAKQLLAATCAKQQIQPEALTIHADRGSSMRSKTAALLLSDLGVTKTHSRPHVSNGNPYSESQFSPDVSALSRTPVPLPWTSFAGTTRSTGIPALVF